MKWTVTTPPSERPVVWATVKAHLRIDSDTEQTLVEGYIDAAADFAQDSTESSLVTQTITAVFYADDVGLTPPVAEMDSPTGTGSVPLATPFYGTSGRAPMLKLPRGPVLAISSVTDGAAHAVTGYTLERVGHSDRLRLSNVMTFPVTVVYTAGYGAASAVPAGIRQSIMAHVGTIYENRESVAKGAVIPVPHSLADFYRLKRRSAGVG